MMPLACAEPFEPKLEGERLMTQLLLDEYRAVAEDEQDDGDVRARLLKGFTKLDGVTIKLMERQAQQGDQAGLEALGCLERRARHDGLEGGVGLVAVAVVRLEALGRVERGAPFGRQGAEGGFAGGGLDREGPADGDAQG